MACHLVVLIPFDQLFGADGIDLKAEIVFHKTAEYAIVVFTSVNHQNTHMVKYPYISLVK